MWPKFTPNLNAMWPNVMDKVKTQLGKKKKLNKQGTWS
jgi:hypothetical protein